MAVVSANQLRTELGLAPITQATSLIATRKPARRLRAIAAIASLTVVSSVTWIAATATADPAYATAAPAAPMSGLTIFAAFFAAALALERLLEPIAGWLNIDKIKADADVAMREATARVTDDNSVHAAVHAADQAGGTHPVREALDTAARRTQRLDDWQFVRTVSFWAVATAIAVAASASFHLYFLRTVGLSVHDRWADVFATGLIIGAGTKPLHDLVTMITTKS